MKETLLCKWRDEYLQELEALLGPRSDVYGLGTVRQRDNHHPPTIWKLPNSHIVDILLTPEAMKGSFAWRLAQWQLAHECVHLIDPNFNPPTIVMEEGIASWFQNKKIELFRSYSDPPYKRAEGLVVPHMESGALSNAIRSMRKDGIRISQITFDLLTTRMPSLDSETARKLTERFDPPKRTPSP